MSYNTKNSDNCIAFKKLMTAYIDNEINHAETENLMEHISVCQKCKNELSNLYTMRQMIKSTYIPKEEVNFTKNIMDRIKTSSLKVESKSKYNKNFMQLLSYGSIAAVMLLALTATVFYSQSKTKTLMAEKRKFETYVVEHTKEYTADIKNTQTDQTTVISVNFEK